jgi:hypothetical protein
MIPAMALGFLGFPRMELFGAELGSSVSTYLGSMIYILRPPSLRIRISRPKSLAMRVI